MVPQLLLVGRLVGFQLQCVRESRADPRPWTSSASSSSRAGQSTSPADEYVSWRPRVPLLRRCRDPRSALCGLRSRHRAVLRRSQRRDRTSVLCFGPCTDREMGAQAEDSVLFKVRGATAATTWDVGHVSLLPRGALVYAPFAPVRLCVREVAHKRFAPKASVLTRASPGVACG